MKSVLISIYPRWCELIANGEKTIEVRKTRPKIKTPFKCYIYCTGGYAPPDSNVFGRGWRKSVIGEFICDDTITDERGENLDVFEDQGQIKREELIGYSNGKALYGWHISDLKIYDEPKALSEFKQGNACPYLAKGGCNYPYYCFRAGKIGRCGDYLEKAPQSWCYVEEL